MKIKKYSIFEASATWDDFINKVNTGIIPKDKADIKVIDKLSKLTPNNGVVLDLSFGDGANSEYFIEKGFDLYGTDISKLAVETMEEKFPDSNWIEHDTLDKFPFSDEKFDLVFARLALHYFKKDDIKNVLFDINRIMKTNSYLYVMVKCSNTGEIDTGKVSYTKDDWIDMISEEFEVVEYENNTKKAYSFEKSASNLLEIIAKKIK